MLLRKRGKNNGNSFHNLRVFTHSFETGSNFYEGQILMKKKILISLLVVFVIFAFGFRGRYAPTFWRTITGGIYYDQGTVAISTAFNYAVDTAANDTYVATVQGITAYNAGLVIWLNPVTDNTGPCTLNINSLGAKSLKTVLGANPVNGHIDAAQIVPLVYDGTNFVILTPDSNP